jgi:phospholipid/cholesterol/gamma-HCH transport system ATP-binding protein
VLDPDPAVRRAVRRRFGMLFQQGALFSAFSVFDNIAFRCASCAFSTKT